MAKENVEVKGAGTAGTEQLAEHAIVVATETKAVATVGGGGAYITGLLNGIKADFVEANDGLDMDFVHMGTWLTINKKGIFQEKDDDTVKYGDTIDVVVGQGEKRWSLWGLKDSPEDGQLIVACKERGDAGAILQAWLNEEHEHQEGRKVRYSINDLELRYMAYVVPVETLSPTDFPKIYLMSFPPSATIAWGKYVMKVYQGGYKAQGVPARTGANRIVTRLTTDEQTSKTDKGVSWLALQFEAIGLFNPADYGLEEGTTEA